jgi:hypothetical protein
MLGSAAGTMGDVSASEMHDSLDLLPAFYALSPNFGDPENDFLDQYHQGLLSPEAKNIYALLLELGQMDSLALRRGKAFLIFSDVAFQPRAGYSANGIQDPAGGDQRGQDAGGMLLCMTS